MASFSTQSLEGEEMVSEGPIKLKAFSFASTGTNHRFVNLLENGVVRDTFVVPPGDTISLAGMDETYDSLSVESPIGDAALVATIHYDPIEQGLVISDAEE